MGRCIRVHIHKYFRLLSWSAAIVFASSAVLKWVSFKAYFNFRNRWNRRDNFEFWDVFVSRVLLKGECWCIALVQNSRIGFPQVQSFLSQSFSQLSQSFFQLILIIPDIIRILSRSLRIIIALTYSMILSVLFVIRWPGWSLFSTFSRPSPSFSAHLKALVSDMVTFPYTPLKSLF